MMQRRILYASLIIVMLVLSVLGIQTLNSPSTYAVTGSEWQSGRIMDDNIFYNPTSMSVTDVQNFLNSKVSSCDTQGTQPATDKGYPNMTHAQYAAANGLPGPPYICLKDYMQVPQSTSIVDNYSGSTPTGAISAAQIIKNAADTYNVSPRALIVILQKESLNLIYDTWPIQYQYKNAMGMGCPDTAPCDPSYAGFYNQVTNAARQFNLYKTNASSYRYQPVATNTVYYNPNTSCGSSNFIIQNYATAGLYNYTPYQPNQAALDNLYGSGDSCSAYGNRNFWRIYSDWFGDTIIRKDFHLMISSTGTTQYVVYNNMKQAIPSTDVKLAWGLDKVPLETVDQTTIDALSNGPDLDVVFRINGGSRLYLADSGLRHYIPSSDLLSAWQLANKTISNVTTDFGNLPSASNNLGYSAQSSGQTAIYMIDGFDTSGNTILRNYPNPDILTAYEGDNPNISIVSPWRFASISSNIATALSSTKVAYGGNEYQVVAGQKLADPYSMAVLYPGTATTISQLTYNRLSTSSAVTPFIRSANSPDVYLIQNGKKYYIPSADIYKAWVGSGLYVNIVSSGFANLIPNSGQTVSSTLTAASAPYLMQSGAKNAINQKYTTAYSTATSFTSSDQLMSALPTSSGVIDTRFIRDQDTGVIAMLDNTSTAHQIPDVPIAQLWGVDKLPVVTIPHATFSNFTTGTILSGVISNSTTTYAVSGGQLHTVPNPTAWNLPTPTNLPDTTVSSFTVGTPLDATAYDGTFYYRVINGTAYATTDANIASLWGITPSASNNSLLIKRYLPPLAMLSPVIQANGLFYVANQTQLISMTPALYTNLAWNFPTIGIDPTTTGMTVVSWQQPILQDTTGNWFVMDGGKVRPLVNTTIRDFWIENHAQPTLTASSQLLSLFPLGPQMERAIKSNSSPNIYSAEAATKRWITSPSTYQTMYAPFTVVTDTLLNTMPTGQNIN